MLGVRKNLPPAHKEKAFFVRYKELYIIESGFVRSRKSASPPAFAVETTKLIGWFTVG